jgi:hypothetical protein
LLLFLDVEDIIDTVSKLHGGKQGNSFKDLTIQVESFELFHNQKPNLDPPPLPVSCEKEDSIAGLGRGAKLYI